MDRDPHDRFEEYVRDGWQPHDNPKSYVCGWCGHHISAAVGLFKHEEWLHVDEVDIYGFHPHRRETDVRICTNCWIATTFLDRKNQLPGPIHGDNLDPRKKNDDTKLIVVLYNEARVALSQRAPSCAVLMFRKILMHVAVEQGAKPGLRFAEYVEYLKTNGIVGKPQYALLDRIRDEGNIENHEVRRASPEQAVDLLNLTTLLIRSVYFSD